MVLRQASVGICDRQLPYQAWRDGANVSKLFLATKAAGMWFSYYSGVAVNFVVIDFSLA